MTIRDRMRRASPISKILEPILDDIVTSVNELQKIVFTGQNQHLENDTTNVVTAPKAGNADGVVDLLQELITNYEAHIGSSTFHTAADSTNVVTEVGVKLEVQTLLNELKDEINNHMSNDAISAAGEALVYALAIELKGDLNAHMDDATAHTNNDDVTAQVALVNATTKPTAIALINEIRVSYEAHRVNLLDVGLSAVHGLADTTNTVTAAALAVDATWEQIIVLLNEIKVDYNAHIPLTTGTVHANADVTNAASQTSASGLSHTNGDDVTAQIASADATTKASAITLANEIRASYEAHRVNLLDVALAAVHGAADATNTVTLTALVPATATWALVAALADELKVDFVAHMALTAGSVHGTADVTNPIAAASIGTFATALYAGLNELRTDFNAHVIESGTSHGAVDKSDKLASAVASTTATAKTLVNEMKTSFNDHISRASEELTKSITTLDDESTV